MSKEIIYCSDLIRVLEKYIGDNGDDRIIVDLETENEFRGYDTISRLVSVPDDDSMGCFCVVVLKEGDWKDREF